MFLRTVKYPKQTCRETIFYIVIIINKFITFESFLALCTRPVGRRFTLLLTLVCFQATVTECLTQAAATTAASPSCLPPPAPAPSSPAQRPAAEAEVSMDLQKLRRELTTALERHGVKADAVLKGLGSLKDAEQVSGRGMLLLCVAYVVLSASSSSLAFQDCPRIAGNWRDGSDKFGCLQGPSCTGVCERDVHVAVSVIPCVVGRTSEHALCFEGLSHMPSVLSSDRLRFSLTVAC